MTGTIDRTPCPQCGFIRVDTPTSRTGLYIDVEFVAKPLGTWSLSGTQMKASGKILPVLKCRNCPYTLVGEFDGENHAVFSPTRKSDNATQNTTTAPAT